MIVTTEELFHQAYGKYALGAYNINNAEQTMGLFKGTIASEGRRSSFRFPREPGPTPTN